MTVFGAMWDAESSRLFLAGEGTIPMFSEGQVYVLELELFGVYRLPVAFRITRIDTDKKIIEFVYLKVNKSNGVQRIHFFSEPGGNGTGSTRFTVPWPGVATTSSASWSSVYSKLRVLTLI